MNKKLVLGTTILAIVILTPSIWACTESQTSEAPIPSPPITPVTPRYIWGYDHQLGYEFEYPEDWKVHSPEEVTPGGGIEKVEMFTKKGEGTSITIIVKSTDLRNLEEVKELYEKIHPIKIVLREDIIEVNGREGYEIIYKSPPTKTREVVFLANGRAYTISYSTTKDLYDASEEIFDHVLNSFIIN